MNIQRFSNSNFFKVRKGRFNETGSKFESVSISTIEFGNSLNSINYEDNFYTNYASSSEQKLYKIIENMYNGIINGNNDILKEYQFDELIYKEKVIDRLINIINESTSSEYIKEDLPSIYKLKNIKVPQIHLYIIINSSLAKILLIDLYHLSIPADLYIKGQLVKRISYSDLPSIYNNYKKNKYNLNNILQENLETEVV